MMSARRARMRLRDQPTFTYRDDGIIEGAESIRLTGTGDRWMLLLHGFNDTPQSVAQLARALHERGWSVSAPLLPQHGRGSDELARRGDAQDWIGAARSEWRAIRTRTRHAVLAGQSMGGAIAVVLAAEEPPSALVLLAPYLGMGLLTRSLASMWPVWQLVTPRLVSNPTQGLHDPLARARALGNPWFTPRLVGELATVVQRAQRALAAAHAPAIVLHARLDYRIPSPSAVKAYERLGSVDKTLVWRDGTGHVLSADAGWEGVSALVASWLDERVVAS
jgi:carboxylesterase